LEIESAPELPVSYAHDYIYICMYIYIYIILHMIKMLVGKDTVYQFKKKMGFNTANTGNKSLFQSPGASQGLVGGGGHNLNNRDVES